MTEARRGRFWLISLGAHGAVAAIILLSPVGQVIFEHEQPERPEVVRHGEELAEVIEDIRDLTVERLRAQNELLASAQTRMGQNFVTLNAHYQPFAAAQAEAARLRFSEQAEQAVERQAALFAAAEQAAEDPENGTATLVEALSEQQGRIITGQEGIRRSLHLLAPEREDLLSQQMEAEESQLKAFQFFGWSRDTHHRILRDRQRLPELATGIEKLKQEIAGLGDAVTQAKAAQATADADAQAATEKQAKNAARDAQRAAKNQLRDAERDQGRKQEQLDRMLAEVKKIEEQLPKHVESRDNNLRVGRNIQRGVNAAQLSVVEAMQAHLAATPDAGTPAADNGASP